MIAQDKSYPHPVIAPFRDDVTPNDFALALAVEFDADNYYLDVHVTHSNAFLTELIGSGKADFAVHVECRRNFYRHVHRLDRPDSRIAIRTSELVGHVEVTAMVVAQREIIDYRPVGLHDDYGSSRFALRRGDVLAIAKTSTFEAYTEYDPLKRLSSILTIERSESLSEGPMAVETSADRIIATLSQGDYDQYSDLRGDPRLAPVLANQVVLPALLHAVFEMASDNEETYSDGMSRRWYRSVDAKLRKMNLNIRQGQTPPLEAVQRLLQGPLRRSLTGLALATAEVEE
jgi:hypothetical protein